MNQWNPTAVSTGTGATRSLFNARIITRTLRAGENRQIFTRNSAGALNVEGYYFH